MSNYSPSLLRHECGHWHAATRRGYTAQIVQGIFGDGELMVLADTSTTDAVQSAAFLLAGPLTDYIYANCNGAGSFDEVARAVLTAYSFNGWAAFSSEHAQYDIEQLMQIPLNRTQLLLVFKEATEAAVAACQMTDVELNNLAPKAAQRQ